MKRFAAASLLVILIVLLAAQAAFSAQAGEKRMNLNLKDAPFPEVIRQILSQSKHSYSVDHALNDLRVSATLRNIAPDEALKVVCKTAGVVYTVENNAYLFRPKTPVVSTPGGTSAPAAAKGPVKIDMATLQYISAGDAAALLNASPPDGLVSITATSVNTLMLRGDTEAIDQAQKVIRLFDVEAALPRPVRVTLSLKANASGLKNPIELSTQSVGPEGVQMPLSISSGKGQADSYMLSASLTPTILPDGSISLTGSGGIDCNLPGAGPDTQRLSKPFDVAASVASGTPVTIASGSVDSGSGKVEFTILATVVVEKGRIVMPKGGLSTMPAQAPRSTAVGDKATDALLQQIWRAQPGQPKFDAIDAVVSKYKSSDLSTQNSIGWLCVNYMEDKSRGLLDRWPCCYVIGRSGFREGVPSLVNVLLHDRAEVMRAVAAEALGEMPYRDDVHEALVQANGAETSTRVREVLAKYLGKN